MQANAGQQEGMILCLALICDECIDRQAVGSQEDGLSLQASERAKHKQLLPSLCCKTCMGLIQRRPGKKRPRSCLTGQSGASVEACPQTGSQLLAHQSTDEGCLSTCTSPAAPRLTFSTFFAGCCCVRVRAAADLAMQPQWQLQARAQ